MLIPPPPPTKAQLAAADRYRRRLDKGDCILRDAAGRMFWQTSGRTAAAKTVRFMLERKQIVERDTDLFGDPSRGQTLGKEPDHG